MAVRKPGFWGRQAFWPPLDEPEMLLLDIFLFCFAQRDGGVFQRNYKTRKHPR